MEVPLELLSGGLSPLPLQAYLLSPVKSDSHRKPALSLQSFWILEDERVIVIELPSELLIFLRPAMGEERPKCDRVARGSADSGTETEFQSEAFLLVPDFVPYRSVAPLHS